MTVEELESRMTVDELADWLAVAALDQEDRDRQDLQETVTRDLTRIRDW